jgi:hypothetical protein
MLCTTGSFESRDLCTAAEIAGGYDRATGALKVPLRNVDKRNPHAPIIRAAAP